MAPSSTDKVRSSTNNYGSVLGWEQQVRPSPCSTDAPTTTNYQAVKGTGDSSLELMDDEAWSLLEDAAAGRTSRRKRPMLFRLAGMATVIAFLALVAYCVLRSKSPVEHGPDVPSDDDAYAATDDALFPVVPDGKRSPRRPPLSTLHPVHDLGLPRFVRPDDSSPSSVLTGGGTGGTTNLTTTTTDHDAQTEAARVNSQNAQSKQSKPHSQSYPTNAWYQNMLLVRDGEPTSVHRAYAVPFLVDAVGPIPGLRVHSNDVSASTSVVQLSTVDEYGLTVGAAPDAASASVTKIKTKSKKNDNSTTSAYSNEYSVENMTPLGLTLAWRKSFPMTSSIVKGMPYGTMKYDKMKSTTANGETWYPTVASAKVRLAKPPVVDGKIKLTCGSTTTNSTSPQQQGEGRQQPPMHRVKVTREVELHFAESDFTWLVFVSRPVIMQCVVDTDTHDMRLQVVGDTDDDDGTDNIDEEQELPFFIRIALAKVCTSNKNPIYCHAEQMLPYTLNLGQGRYDDLLRNHSHLIPGPDTSFDYDVDHTRQQIKIVFDWDARDVRNYNVQPVSKDVSSDRDLIAFALPHHLDLMGTRWAPGYLKYCTSTLIGPACLLSSSRWTMVESVPTIDFRAPRPPVPWAMRALAKSAQKDIQYRLPNLARRGAGDTYFSGKMLAKLGRILTIVEELKELCSQGTSTRRTSGASTSAYMQVCKEVKLPSDREFRNALASLRSSVEVWLNGKAVTPFVFDGAWGGVVSCGCDNPDGGNCRNKFPDCPAFTDPGLNFGNAFYNDLHFHYGYHIYAAAVVSHFDPDWGKEFFEHVLLLIRNIANPSDDGDYFPAFRHKDWYQGHSWASGVVPPYLNGRNQESSSEAIAAYEAVALYGAVMTSAWEEEGLPQNVAVAIDVHEAGLILTATELRSTRRYYHVRDQGNANQALKIYPSEYSNHAIGMMWNTMAQYQTWFGGKPYLAAGIQLLPITPIAEQRDGVQWLSEMYPSFAKTCAANKECKENGWSVPQLASLATIGYPKKALKDAEALPREIFASAGGNGHSLTNTLWYIATRPIINDPMTTGNMTVGNATTEDVHKDNVHVLTHCYRPKVCTDYILDTIADEYSCRQRMTYLIDTMGHTQQEACFTVAKIQFPEQCGACNPNATNATDVYKPQCPPCTVEECESDLNRCPSFRQTFVCKDGPNTGGCSRFPWDVRSSQCTGCCELTECAKKLDR